MATLAPFDASKYLDNEGTIAELLSAALEDPDIFVSALGAIAKARGMTQIARESGLGRESLYKALMPGAKLRFDTVQRVMGALGVKFSVTAAGGVAGGGGAWNAASICDQRDHADTLVDCTPPLTHG